MNRMSEMLGIWTFTSMCAGSVRTVLAPATDAPSGSASRWRRLQRCRMARMTRRH
jgi:hypothetical protein